MEKCNKNVLLSKFFLLLIICFLLMCLSACGTKKIFHRNKDDNADSSTLSAKNGRANQSEFVSISLKASLETNPDFYGRPSPIMVTIYQLKSIAAFAEADFFALDSQPKETLAGDFIKRDSIEVRPGQTLSLNYLQLPETNYFGIVAAYQNLSAAQWRSITVANPKGNTSLDIQLESLKLIVKNDIEKKVSKI